MNKFDEYKDELIDLLYIAEYFKKSKTLLVDGELFIKAPPLEIYERLSCHNYISIQKDIDELAKEIEIRFLEDRLYELRNK